MDDIYDTLFTFLEAESWMLGIIESVEIKKREARNIPWERKERNHGVKKWEMMIKQKKGKE